MSVASITAADLRTVDLFDDTSDAELEEWLRVARPRDVPAGGVLAEQGEAPKEFILLLEGSAYALLAEGAQTEPVARQVAPTWIGAIAVLTGGLLGVRMQAETDCRAATIAAEDFRRLALAQPAVHERVMQRVGPVMSRVSAIEQNRERLAALGTMAAGLAHELNNPAAAARRSAAQLNEALEVINSTMRRFVEAGIEREDAARLLALQQEAADRERTGLDALDAADAEDELLEELEDIGVPEAWRVVEPLVAAGVDRDWVKRVADAAGPATDAAFAWMAAGLSAQGLVGELCESTERMSSLVGAVKTYAYMDRGGLVEIDLHEGLETTLTVMAHKLKHTSVQLDRDYDRSLPKLTVRGSELNQVWTNLIDNAIGAVGDSGTIAIATRREGDCAIVEVTDDGPGIPPEIQDRIFEQFFTTKEVGQGTGLGLATARMIVVDRHDGSLTFDSKPGATTFRVSLPLTHA